MQCYFITPAVDILYGMLCARGLADYGTEGNSDSFPLQLAILPWYSDGLVLKSKFLSVSAQIEPSFMI